MEIGEEEMGSPVAAAELIGFAVGAALREGSRRYGCAQGRDGCEEGCEVHGGGCKRDDLRRGLCADLVKLYDRCCRCSEDFMGAIEHLYIYAA